MRDATYNPRKFQELLVYIAERTADDRSFGDTKLNKTLYWVDFFGYSNLGRAVTGARYQKQTYGPLAVPLIPARSALVETGDVRIEEPPAGDRVARKTVALRRPDLGVFSADELELIDEVIDLVRRHTAVSVSALSHRQSAGWNLVEIGDEIPYPTALIEKEPPPASTMERSREAAAALGW